MARVNQPPVRLPESIKKDYPDLYDYLKLNQVVIRQVWQQVGGATTLDLTGIEAALNTAEDEIDGIEAQESSGELVALRSRLANAESLIDDLRRQEQLSGILSEVLQRLRVLECNYEPLQLSAVIDRIIALERDSEIDKTAALLPRIDALEAQS